MKRPTATPSNTRHGPEHLDSELTDLLPDFLNGHLDRAQEVTIETALAINPQLQEQLDIQRLLQNALRAESVESDARARTTAPSRGTGFDAIADRIEDSRGGRWQTMFQQWWSAGGARAGIPAFAMMLAVGMFAGTNLVTPGNEINEFETRIGAADHGEPTLRILPHLNVNSTAFAELLSDYDLQLGQLLPDSNMADVMPASKDTDIDSVARALANDSRVLHAKVIGDDMLNHTIAEKKSGRSGLSVPQ